MLGLIAPPLLKRPEQDAVDTHFSRALRDGEQLFVLAASGTPSPPQHAEHCNIQSVQFSPPHNGGQQRAPQQAAEQLASLAVALSDVDLSAVRPPLPPPQLTGLTSAGSASRDLALCSNGARDLVTCHSSCSSIGTCSSEDDGPATAPPSAPDSRSVSFAAGALGGSRRASLLSDSGRASRRASQPEGSPNGAGQLTPTTPPEEGPWWASKWSFGTHSEQNGRKHMEDRLTACDVSDLAAFSAFKRAGFFAVFDGHSGPEAAEHLQEHLLQYITEASPDQLAASPGAVLGAAVERAEAEIIRQFSEAACNAGSTLLAALLLDDKLHVANVGDCRAVLARGTDAIQITTDHKPHDEGEAARIASAHALTWTPPGEGAGAGAADGGGVASAGGSCRCSDSSGGDAAWLVHEGSVVAPVITSDGYLYGELAVARAIGSQHLKRDPTKKAFTHQPDIHSVQLVREDDMLLLASDGLWDKVENPEAVQSARRCMARERDVGATARALIDRAVRQNSTDNISVVVVCLHDRGISLPKTNSMLFRRLQLDSSSRPATPAGSSCPTPAAAGSPSGGSRCETPNE